MSPLARLRHAAKPASWPKLLVPLALGQAIGMHDGHFDPLAAALALLFTVCDALFIVFLNDYGDRAIDTLKRERFPNGSSKKTIPDGILPAWLVLAMGIAAGAGVIGTAILIDRTLERSYAIPLAMITLSLFLAYTFPPFKLNYRGGGELLEMIGVGALLPWTSAYIQSGELTAPGMWLLPGFTLMAAASAVASGLSDERSDLAGGKHTAVTRYGNRRARRITEGAFLLGLIAWVAVANLETPLPGWVAMIPALVALLYFGALVAESRAATTDRPKGLSRYKQTLHRGIWRSGAVAAMLLAWWQLEIDVLLS